MDVLAFDGFTPSTIRFLIDLSEHNTKDWFEANRSVYETELLNPFKALVKELTPVMYNIDPQFELRPHRVLSRIYRDTRFSKNKEPYKTCLWASFQIPVGAGQWQFHPGFFFELNIDGIFFGVGFYNAPRKSMDAFRDKIVFNPSEFREHTEVLASDGFRIEGEAYKRLLKNSLPDYFQPWMQKKTIWVSKQLPHPEQLYTASFAAYLGAEFKKLEWLYHFFRECE